MIRLSKNNSLSIALLGMVLVLFSCSRKKSTFTHLAYHETTARYNAYFNGREINKEAMKSLESSHKDDYSELLPLFIYGSEEDATAIYEDMEEVIKKCSKVIERHSIYLKKKEHNKWIDDSYMLIGKARFYKGEFFGALEIFEYVERAFKEEPIRVEALTWIAQTHMRLENEVKTVLTLEKIDKIRDIPLEYRGHFNLVYADYLIQKEDYKGAIEKLEDAVVHIKRRKDRRRPVYVLAQLYHLLKDYKNASRYYSEVIKLRPEYTMDFNARISRAKAYDVDANNSVAIKKELNKMLKDAKNKEFNDQIYFALAELAFRENEDSLGITYLKKSASSSVDNTKQKSLAYLKLGHIYFDRTNYILAQAYYDSTSTILDEGHKDFEIVMDRLGGLTKLVDNIKIVEVEDSLQAVAQMDEKEREKMIRKIIRKVEEEEERKRQELESSFALDYNTGNSRNETQSIGKWYFYNQSTKSLGTTEFFSVWGNRKLEDNWRRRNKKSTGFNASSLGSAGGADSTANDGLTNKDVEYYLKDLPLTDSAMDVSHNKIIDALFQIGIIYKEDFQDHKKSNKNFEQLVGTYDTCRHALPSYYYLYRNYLHLGDNGKATFYKNKITTDYPFSEYARLIKNPSYAKQRRDLAEKIEAFYGATYRLFDYRQYNDVVVSCNSADTLFGDNVLKPKFDMLRALAIGKMGRKDEFIEALQAVVVNHPKDDVSDRAEEIIKALNNPSSKKQEEKPKEQKIVEYDKNTEGEHVFVLIVPEETKDANRIKISISDFNSSSFRESKLIINSIQLDDKVQMISVNKFKSAELGMNYFDAFRLNKTKLASLNNGKFKSFIISKKNLKLFVQDKNVGAYEDFFKKNYLQISQ